MVGYFSTWEDQQLGECTGEGVGQGAPHPVPRSQVGRAYTSF
jgi:hypothetical protein